MSKTRNGRLETLLHFVLAGGGNTGEGPAMERVEGGEYFKSAFVVAKSARQFEQSFVGLAAAVAEKAFARADEAHQRLG